MSRHPRRQPMTFVEFINKYWDSLPDTPWQGYRPDVMPAINGIGREIDDYCSDYEES